MFIQKLVALIAIKRQKKAKKGVIIENETYAEQCAAERLGVTLSTLRKLINKGT